MHYFTDSTWWGHMGWMMVFWVLGFVLVLLLVVYVVRYLAMRSAPGRNPKVGDREDEAERILRERYARGEIDEPEYERRREELRSPG